MSQPKAGRADELASEPEPSKPEGDSALLEAVLAETETPPARIDGIVVAKLAGHDSAGEPLIDFAANPEPAPLRARSLVALPPEQVGREVAVMFEQGDVRRPIVMGQMADASAHRIELHAQAGEIAREEDGEQIVLTLDKRLVVRCGKSSLTLTPAGKIIVSGEYVLTRANGVNRIQGGAVRIN